VKVRAEGFGAFSRRRRKQDGAALANRALLMESPAPIASIPASINSVMTCALSALSRTIPASDEMLVICAMQERRDPALVSEPRQWEKG
jgi:hypothetical protein